MTSSVTSDAQREDLSDQRATSGATRPLTSAEALLWTLFGLALLVGFLFLVAGDYQLRNLLTLR